METTKTSEPADMKLEVVVIGVSDVDVAKAFYQKLGWRLDADFAKDDFRVVQFTPHNSGCSIIFGKGVTSPKPGTAKSLTLAVDDIEAARNDLIERGIKVSDIFHFADGPFNDADKERTLFAGRDSEGRSYFSFASFEDPDGNGYLLQEIKTRLPGREWKSTRSMCATATLAELLHETEQHHGNYEKTHGAHNWWDRYAPYLSARQNGSSPEKRRPPPAATWRRDRCPTSLIACLN